jgi:hypothetical protein
MSRWSNDDARRGRRDRRASKGSAASARSAWVVVILITAGLGAGAAAAQSASQSADNAALRQQIERRFDVVPLREGLALVPRSAALRVRSIELTDGAIAIDGVPATGAEVREKLGVDADAVIRLSYLDAASRRALFAPPTPAAPLPPAAPPPAAAPAEPPPPAPPATPDIPRSRRSRGMRSSDRVRIGGSVQVNADEVINGDVVAVGGSVRVDGEVHGDVVSVGGSVHLGPEAIVTGDVAVIGGALQREPGARVDGDFKEIGIGAIDLSGLRWEGLRWPWFGRAFGSAFALLTTVGRVAILCLLAALVILLGHEYVERISARAAAEPFKAGAIGFLAQLLFLPVLVVTIVILVATIVGIPLLLLIPFALLALGLVALVGFTAVAYRVGSLAGARLGWDPLGPYGATIVGILIVISPLLLARLLGLIGGPVFPMTFALGLLGFCLEYLVWTVGFGAVALAWFNRARTAPPPPIVP